MKAHCRAQEERPKDHKGPQCAGTTSQQGRRMKQDLKSWTNSWMYEVKQQVETSKITVMTMMHGHSHLVNPWGFSVSQVHLQYTMCMQWTYPCNAACLDPEDRHYALLKCRCRQDCDADKIAFWKHRGTTKRNVRPICKISRHSSIHNGKIGGHDFLDDANCLGSHFAARTNAAGSKTFLRNRYVNKAQSEAGGKIFCNPSETVTWGHSHSVLSQQTSNSKT